MTFEEIKNLMPHFTEWKNDIALIFGDEYSKRYCTWERFIDHIKILYEISEK